MTDKIYKLHNEDNRYSYENINQNKDTISIREIKTNASIPFEFREPIGDVIDAAKHASLIKITRGSRVVNENLNPANNALIWKTSKDNQYNSFKYSIDLDNPFIKNYVSEKIISEKNLKMLLEVISNNLPVPKIIQNNDDDPSKHDRLYKKEKLSEEELISVKKMFNYQCTKMTKAAAFAWLLSFEPYCYCQAQLNQELNG